MSYQYFGGTYCLLLLGLQAYRLLHAYVCPECRQTPTGQHDVRSQKKVTAKAVRTSDLKLNELFLLLPKFRLQERKDLIPDVFVPRDLFEY
jgi:hypothetical protein